MLLDLLDRQIMSQLDLNARTPATTIARKLRASKETVNFRINRLVEQKYIRLFYTIFNASKIGYYYYKVFIMLYGATPEIEGQIVQYIKSQKSCSNLRICEGPYDMTFLNIVKNPGELLAFMDDLKARFGDYILQKEIHSVVKISKLNQKFQPNGNTLQLSFKQTEVGSVKVDETDMKIMMMLATDARAKLIDISNGLNVSPKVIKYRLKRMEKEGIIMGYNAAINFEKLGLGFVQVNIGLKNGHAIPAIMEFFYQTEKCLFALQLLGKYDLTVEMHVENDKALKEIMSGFKEKFLDHYVYFDIVHVYREYVINWLPFEAYAI